MIFTLLFIFSLVCNNIMHAANTQKLTHDYTNTTTQASAPVIRNLHWGSIKIQEPSGKTSNYNNKTKDCIIIPTSSSVWDWKDCGTRHNPGVTMQAVQKLIDANVEIIILSRGMDLVLQVPKTTIQYLHNAGYKQAQSEQELAPTPPTQLTTQEVGKRKQFFILQSCDAAKLYNQLISKGLKVGLLLHSTC